MKSKSPFGHIFNFTVNDKKETIKIDSFINNERQNVVVQGLGFVGSAMVAALCNASNEYGEKIYNVIGVDLADDKNYWKIGLVNNFTPPIRSLDTLISRAYNDAKKNSNLMATYSSYAYSIADIIVVDIHLDIVKEKLGDAKNYKFSFSNFIKSLKVISDKIKENTLLVIETTVPPGTTEKKILPLFKESFKKNNLNFEKFYLSHSYERVMPGVNYLNSINNYYRVYSGINKKSKLKAKLFFESFINTKDFPLSELHSTNASEISKVLENSYRATNIALIKEWVEFADSANVNLFEVINAIKLRNTHKNIMNPGLGVGGYCLTKDSLLADWSYRNFYNNIGHLEFSINSINVNDLMPKYTFSLINKKYKSIKNKKILILGVSYLNDVFDTRYSPTEYLYDLCIENGSKVFVHDTITTYWEEKDLKINTSLESLNMLDCEIVIFAVKHNQYLNFDFEYFIKLLPNLKMVIDANNVLNDSFANSLAKRNILIYGVGKGHWNELNK